MILKLGSINEEHSQQLHIFHFLVIREDEDDIQLRQTGNNALLNSTPNIKSRVSKIFNGVILVDICAFRKFSSTNSPSINPCTWQSSPPKKLQFKQGSLFNSLCVVENIIRHPTVHQDPYLFNIRASGVRKT